MAQKQSVEAANAEFAARFKDGDKAIPPARAAAVVTCMDARLHPEKFLGADIGDFHVIRNAGGRVDESAIRSLVISQRLLGTKEIFVIHHTDCGMETFENKDLKDKIKADLGVDAGDRDWLPFKGLEQSVRTDVGIIKSSPLIPDDIPVHGYVYQVETGKIVPVD